LALRKICFDLAVFDSMLFNVHVVSNASMLFQAEKIAGCFSEVQYFFSDNSFGEEHTKEFP